MKPRPAVLALVVSSLAASVAMAQPDSRFALSGSLGVATDSADTGVAAGGALLFDAHDRLSLEGLGSYLARGDGADAWHASAGVLLNLRPASASLVPYGAIGAGLYHVSLDLDRPRFLGPAGTQFAAGSSVCPAPGMGFGAGPGPGFGTGATACSGAAGYWGVGRMPSFYARRLGALTFPRGASWGTRDFTDPAVDVGAGLRFNLTDRLMLRPDARALVVFAEGETHTVGVFVVHLGYRF